MCDNNCKLTCNTGEKHICFGSDVVPVFSSGNSHVASQVVYGPLHRGSDLVKGIPFIGIPLDTGVYAEIEIFIGVSSRPFLAVLQGFLQSQLHCPFL